MCVCAADVVVSVALSKGVVAQASMFCDMVCMRHASARSGSRARNLRDFKA